MLDGIVTRGTTSTQVFKLPNNVKKSELKDFSVSFRQKNKTILTKGSNDIINASGSDEEIVVSLTPEETLLFNPKIEFVEVQIKGLSLLDKVFIIDNYKLRLEDCFDDSALGQPKKELKNDANSESFEEMRALMHKYASLCNDIYKECVKIKEEIEEAAKKWQ
jgi:hypothetical protein